jgi:DHA1 family multidrug resistance protein-like MFS transporter
VIRLAIALAFGQTGFHAWIATIPVALHSVGRPDGEIGAIVGAAAVFNIFGSLAVGGLLDRFGGRTVYFAGCGAMALAAAPIALGIVDAHSSFAMWLPVRLLQGVGLAAVLPAIQILVPDRVTPARMPTAMAGVGVAANVSLALTPPLSLLLLEGSGLAAVGVAVCLSAASGVALLATESRQKFTLKPAASDPVTRPSRGFRPAWRPEWAVPLSCVFLFVAHWGVVVGYLAQRSEAAGAEIGLFFTGDALALLAVRVPAGWLAGRIPALPLLLAGTVITAASLALLLLPPTTPLLVLSGIGTGAGGALVFPVLLIELTRRSDSRDRGSAFGLYYVAFGSGIAIGSLGIAPVFDRVGFEPAMAMGILACLASGVVALFDAGLRRDPAEFVASAGSLSA